MKTGYKVCDAMTEKPICLSPNDSIKRCAKVMGEQHVGAIILRDKKNSIVGIVTEQDIVRKAVAFDKLPSRAKVSSVMEKNLSTISPEKDIFEALLTMRDRNIRHLPVVDGNRFLGLLTLKDVLKIEPQLFDLLVEKFELREEEHKPIYRVNDSEGFCQSCGEFSNALIDNENTLVCKDCAKEPVSLKLKSN
jgi:signal-transduction protein with cAMP-binding, CBS, and nucleotidyltransferase domain